MVSKTQWRVISIVLAIVLLLAAFMTGATGITDGIKPIGDVRKDYTRFKANLDNLEDNEKRCPRARRNTTNRKPLTTSRRRSMIPTTPTTRRQTQNTTRMCSATISSLSPTA